MEGRSASNRQGPQLVPLAVREIGKERVVPKLDLSQMWDRADGGDATERV